MLAKSASPTSIPSDGNTPVTYTVRIDFLEDEAVNSIEDDQFPALDPATDCELFDGDTDESLGAVTLPDTFISGDYIICEYTYEPPAGTAGDEHVNTVTINVGEAAQAPTIIGPGDEPGTWDVSEAATILYEAAPTPDPTSPPEPEPTEALDEFESLLLTPSPTRTPTPVPTPTQTPIPVATASTGAVGAISPPSTGDGGLR
jgi:hypothetical protein